MSAPHSLWLQNPPQETYPPLQEDLTADICVVGGGITGLTTALLLQEAGVDVVLLEARQIASGTTGHTVAKITSQHDLIYHTLIDRYGQELAAQYADAQQTAIEEISSLIQRHSIDCAFERQNAYQFSESSQGTAALEQEFRAAQRLNLPAELLDPTQLNPLKLPFKPHQALRFTNQAHFDPVAYTRALAQIFTRLGGQVFEQTRVQEILPGEVLHSNGRLFAPHIILASHFPIRNIPGWYFARQCPSRSYCLALENIKPFEGMWLSIRKHGKSLRMQGNTLVLCGVDHITGRQSRQSHYDILRSYAKTLFPQSREIAHWSAEDAIAADSVPYVGSCSDLLPGVWVATGFAKWGMTNSMAAAMILRDSILEYANPWQNIFSPKRPTTANAAWITLSSVARTVANYAIWPFSRQPVCTHLGCRTHFQAEEGTWECPCHGSRFDSSGVPIDGPAIKNLDLSP